MLTDIQVKENKNRFIYLIRSVNRENSNIEDLVNWLENRSDFFEAPASTQYHCSYKGGLCEHSLNVYDTMCKLVNTFNIKCNEDSIKILALLHDISKANYYEVWYRNVKDDNGKWIQEANYRTKDFRFRFNLGNHEQNSEYIVRTFFDLSAEESAAILSHHAGMSFDSSKMDFSTIFNMYDLASLLHTADFLSTFLIEKLPE